MLFPMPLQSPKHLEAHSLFSSLSTSLRLLLHPSVLLLITMLLKSSQLVQHQLSSQYNCNRSLPDKPQLSNSQGLLKFFNSNLPDQLQLSNSQDLLKFSNSKDLLKFFNSKDLLKLPNSPDLLKLHNSQDLLSHRDFKLHSNRLHSPKGYLPKCNSNLSSFQLDNKESPKPQCKHLALILMFHSSSLVSCP